MAEKQQQPSKRVKKEEEEEPALVTLEQRELNRKTFCDIVTKIERFKMEPATDDEIFNQASAWERGAHCSLSNQAYVNAVQAKEQQLYLQLNKLVAQANLKKASSELYSLADWESWTPLHLRAMGCAEGDLSEMASFLNETGFTTFGCLRGLTPATISEYLVNRTVGDFADRVMYAAVLQNYIRQLK